MLVFPETQNHYIYCWNAPLGLVDNNGLFPTALAGAIGGGIIGGISYSVGAAISGDFSWKGLAASSAGGAVTGALMCSGVTNPRVLGAAYAGTSAFVTGAIDTAQAAYKTYKSGGSASDVAKTAAVGLGNIAVSTVANAGIGALGGALFSGVGKAGAVGIGAISRGGATLIDELRDDKKGVNVGRVIRSSAAGAAEAYTAMTMFSGLKVGIDQGGTGTEIVKTTLGSIKGNISSDVSSLKYGAIKAIARLLPSMGSPAPVEVMCSGENGSSLADMGYTKDKNGCWHRPNGQFASNAEVRSGLPQSKINEIVNTPKGSRPNPSSYLSKEYIDNHLARFDDGVSVIQTEWAYNRYSETNGFVGVPDDNSLFVMPKDYCDGVIARANGDISVIEHELGFPKGYFRDGGGLVRIDAPNTSDLNIRVPSGNETGANKLWIPGGKTSGGVPEAITNTIPLDNTTITRIEVD